MIPGGGDKNAAAPTETETSRIGGTDGINSHNHLETAGISGQPPATPGARPATAGLTQIQEMGAREAVLRYAELGWRVVLVHGFIQTTGFKPGEMCTCGNKRRCAESPKSRGKHPVLPAWQERATSDPEELLRQLDAQGGLADCLNVGLLMGGPSRLVGLDTDGEQGRATIARLESVYGPLPETLQALTGSGQGDHRVYYVPDDLDFSAITTRADALGPDSKVDTRAEGGQLAVAPSLHWSGNRYKWVNEAPIAPMPKWLYDELVKHCGGRKKSSVRSPTGTAQRPPSDDGDAAPQSWTIDIDAPIVSRARKYVAKMPGAVAGSGGHNATWNVAQALVRGFELPDQTAFEVLLFDFNPRCQPPWSPAELRHKVESARAKSEKPSGYLVAGAPEGAPQDARGEPDLWTKLLSTNERGFMSTQNNAMTILLHHEDWASALAYDVRGDRVLLVSEPPFADDYAGPRRARLPREFTEADLGRLQAWLERSEYGITPGKQACADAVECAARQQEVDTVRQYLEALEWHGAFGESDLDRWLIDFCGAENSAYVRAVGARFMIGAVARVLDPGCQVDQVPVFEGAQGIGKSSVLRELAGPEHFVDELGDIGSRDAAMQLQRPWIVELAELDAIGRAQLSAIKAFLSRRVDVFRAPYGRRVVEHARRCVFAGTTNDHVFLKDSTGNRRFLPVRMTRINLPGLMAHRDLLWAEAVARYRAGEPWWISEPDLLAAAQAEQSARYLEDSWQDQLETLLASSRSRELGVSIGDALTALGIEVGRQTRADQMRCASALQALGWQRRQVRDGTRRPRRYFPTSGAVADDAGSTGASAQVIALAGVAANRRWGR